MYGIFPPRNDRRTTTTPESSSFPETHAYAYYVHHPPPPPPIGSTVKSAEPVLAAIVGTVFYAKAPSFYKVCCLPIIVGGVAFASLKKGADGSYSLKFDATALIFGMLANAFAAFKGGENTKLMSDKGVAQRYGGVGNQVREPCIYRIYLLLHYDNSRLPYPDPSPATPHDS
jgi:hypothetical protein